jgi:hypothetical protein
MESKKIINKEAPESDQEKNGFKNSFIIPEMLFTPTGTINVTHNAHNIGGQAAGSSNIAGPSISGRHSDTGTSLQVDELVRKSEFLKLHQK